MSKKGAKKRFKGPAIAPVAGRFQVPQQEPVVNYPIFCFKYLHKDWGFNTLMPAQALDFCKALQKRAQLSWQDIMQSPRHGLGTEKIPLTAIKAGSQDALLTPEVTDLLALRFSGKAPFLGLRRGAIFHVLYIDAHFKLYKH